MFKEKYRYIIAGGGLAGSSAVEGIREKDKEGNILLIGAESHLPYDRPPLTKKLWWGKKKVEEIFLHDLKFYEDNKVDLMLGIKAVSIDPRQKSVTDETGREHFFEKLLLSTGGSPRRMTIPGSTLEGICYYRTLDDYLRIRPESVQGRTAVIIGGGFIGSEIAASLEQNGVSVTMIFPDTYLCQRIFPAPLAGYIQAYFQKKNIKIQNEDMPAAISKNGNKFVTHTGKGEAFESDMLIAGVGITPEVTLAHNAQLITGNGIIVNNKLQTSAPDIYAAGDNAYFPCKDLGKSVRMEHWDNALNMGKKAGRNMAGAEESYDYLPYFFSDLFEFGYEAVGEIDSTMEIYADWQEEFNKGVIYYLTKNKVRGVMTCNIYGKLDQARALLQKDTIIKIQSLKGAII